MRHRRFHLIPSIDDDAEVPGWIFLCLITVFCILFSLSPVIETKTTSCMHAWLCAHTCVCVCVHV